jgi:hypothetical protein
MRVYSRESVYVLVSYREEKSVGVGVTQLFLFEIACDGGGWPMGLFKRRNETNKQIKGNHWEGRRRGRRRENGEDEVQKKKAKSDSHAQELPLFFHSSSLFSILLKLFRFFPSSSVRASF